MTNQYDEIGADYIKGQAEFLSKTEDAAKKFIIESIGHFENKLILDVGCGHGIDVQVYDKLGAKAAFGIDSSVFMMREARKRVVSYPERINYGDLEQIPFGDNNFDIITGRFAMHYLETFDKFYEEAARVLNPGGLFIQVAHHPLMDLHFKKDKCYEKREIIELELFNNKVKIKFPTHTMIDYFSPTFFKHFTIEDYKEQTRGREEYRNIDGDLERAKIPGYLAFKARKR